MLRKVSQQTVFCFFTPTWPRRCVPLSDHVAEFPRERSAGSDLRRSAANFVEIRSASSSCFNGNQAVCRGEVRIAGEKEALCFVRRLRGPYCFRIQLRTMAGCPLKPRPCSSRQSWLALRRPSSGTFAKEVVFFSRSGLPVCLRGIFNTR